MNILGDPKICPSVSMDRVELWEVQVKTSDLDQPQMLTRAQRVTAAPVGGHPVTLIPPHTGGRGFYKEGEGNRTKRWREGLRSSLHADEHGPF